MSDPMQTIREALEQAIFGSGTITDFRNHACRALAALDAMAGQAVPVGFVPIHPRTGPLWANAVPSLDCERPVRYPAMALYASPVQAAPEWQPIDTAPKDRTRVLCYRNGTFIGAVEKHSCGAFWEFGSGMTLRAEPTHWMPLPAAPTTTPKGE